MKDQVRSTGRKRMRAALLSRTATFVQNCHRIKATVKDDSTRQYTAQITVAPLPCITVQQQALRIDSHQEGTIVACTVSLYSQLACRGEVPLSGHWGPGYSSTPLQVVVANGLFLCMVPEYRKSCELQVSQTVHQCNYYSFFTI